jgi:peptide-methionine (S)-S-oxide reductase
MLRYTSELLDEYRAIYPNLKDFVNSTATARVNGYVSGYGDPGQLQVELDSLGLSPEGRKRLVEFARRYQR